MRENMATLAYQMRTARTVSGWVPGWESNAPLIAKALSILSGNGDLKNSPAGNEVAQQAGQSGWFAEPPQRD